MIRRRIPRPVWGVVAAYLTALLLGTGLLALPVSSAGPGGLGLLPSLFTATSALSVTGLVVFDPGTVLTPFGQAVVLGLIQVGGLGVMVFTMLLGMLVAARVGLRLRRVVAQETHMDTLGGLRPMVLRILLFSVITEAVVAVCLILRFRLGPGREIPGVGTTWGEAVWSGVFHAVSAFNNAGFSLRLTSLMEFSADPLVLLPVAAAVIVGGLGFPVLLELVRRYRLPHTWSLTTRIVVTATPVLLAAGTVFLLVQEWANPETLGGMDAGEKVLNAFFQSTIARTAGFNSVDTSALHPVSWLGLDILMFVGGGPAGTAGGVKVTTVAVLLAMTWTEVTGGRAVNLLGRRIARSVHRQATTVVVLAGLVVTGATMVLMLDSPETGLDRVLFEVVSAFATVGLSTGITADLPGLSQCTLIVCMIVGRVGPVTLAAALALRARPVRFELPRERPLIG